MEDRSRTLWTAPFLLLEGGASRFCRLQDFFPQETSVGAQVFVVIPLEKRYNKNRPSDRAQERFQGSSIWTGGALYEQLCDFHQP